MRTFSVRLALLASLAALAGLVTAAALAAPTGPASATAKPLTVLVPYGNFFQPVVDGAIQRCSKTTGIAAKSIPDPATYDDLNLKLQVQAAAGNAPDLAVQGLNEVISMGDNTYAVDLAPYTKGLKQYSPKVMPALGAGKANGRLISIPWGISLPVLFVNEDLLRAAGIDPSKPFASWKAVAAAANKLADPSSGRAGIAFANQEGWIPLQFLLNWGSNFVGANGKPAFANAHGTAAAGFLNDLYKSGAAFKGTEDQAKDAFITGKTAMFFASTAFIPSWKDNTFKWTTMPFPTSGAGPIKLAAGGAGISMFAKPDRRKDAWKLVNCLFAPATIKGVVEKLGYMPVRTDVTKILAPNLLSTPPYKAPFSQFKFVVPWYAFPGKNGAQALKMFNDGWTKAIQTSTNPGPDLATVAKQVSSVLG